MEDSWASRKGHIETVHAYTNDQNLLDNYHKGARRGRSAAINMVITTTGAGSAVSQGHPQPEGQADRQCGARAHAQRLTGHHEPHREEGRDP
jgi:glyceraldehyde-3-phosphate dehydrogenase/erythrose-4-phosphate dehydrogenase